MKTQQPQINEEIESSKEITQISKRKQYLTITNYTVCCTISIIVALIGYYDDNINSILCLAIIIQSALFCFVELRFHKQKKVKTTQHNQDKSDTQMLLNKSNSILSNIKNQYFEWFYVAIRTSLYASLLELLIILDQQKQQIILISFFLSHFSNLTLRNMKRQSISQFTLAAQQIYTVLRIQIELTFSVENFILNFFYLIFMLSYIDNTVISNQQQIIKQQNERTKTENIMRLYQSILSIIPEGIAVINSDKKLLYANPTLKKILQSKGKKEIVQILMNLGNSQSGVQSSTQKQNGNELNEIKEIIDSNNKLKTHNDQQQKSKGSANSPKLQQQTLNINNNQQENTKQISPIQSQVNDKNRFQEQCSIVDQKGFTDSQKTLKSKQMSRQQEPKEDCPPTKNKSQTSISNFNNLRGSIIQSKANNNENNNQNSDNNVGINNNQQTTLEKVEDDNSNINNNNKQNNSKSSSINKVSSMNISKEQIKSQYSQKSSRIIKKSIRRDSKPDQNRRLKTLYVKENTNQSLNNYQSDHSEILSYQGFGFNMGEEESEQNNNNNNNSQKPVLISQITYKRGSEGFSNKANQADNSPISRSSAHKKKSFSITPSSSFCHSAQRYTRKKFTSNQQSSQISESQIKQQLPVEVDKSIQLSLPPAVSNISQQQFSENTINDSVNQNEKKQPSNNSNNNGNQNDQLKQSEIKIINNSEFNINIFQCKQDDHPQNFSKQLIEKQIHIFERGSQQNVSNHASGLKIQQQMNYKASSSNSNQQNILEKSKIQVSHQTITTNKQKDSSCSTIPFTLKVKTRKHLSQSKIDNKITLRKTDVSNIIDKMLQSSPRKKQDGENLNTSGQKDIKDPNTKHKLSVNESQNPNMKRGSFISQLKKEEKSDLSYVQQTDTVTKIQVKFKNKDLVLQFLTVDVLQENTKKDPLVMIMVQDLWQDLYQKKVQDIQKDKMRIFASLSHELRTPLNCSISMLEVLKDEISPHQQKYIDEYLNPALFSNKLLLNQINDILDFVQMDSGKFKYSFLDFNILGLLKDCQKLVSMQAIMKNVQLKVSVQQGTSDNICSDPNRIRQIILNFLSNALKFTKKGFIEIGFIPYDDNGLYEIYVKDTGIGITKENLDTIFQFCNKINYDKKDEGLNSQGCGLGLTISNSIAKGLVTFENVDSGIKVRSDYGKGSTFSIVVQDMNHGIRQTDKIKEITDNLQIELLKQSRIYEQSNKDDLSPNKIESRQRLSLLLRNGGQRKSFTKKNPTHLVSPSQVIIEDEQSVIDQHNTSVDYLKCSIFKNNLPDYNQGEGSFSPEKRSLIAQNQKGGNLLDSAVVVEFDEDSSQKIKINSNISIKNNIDRFLEDDSNYQKEQQNNNNNNSYNNAILSKHQISSTSQYKYPICKSPLKQSKHQFNYDFHNQKSETFNNLTSENIPSSRVIGNNMIYGIQDDSKSDLDNNIDIRKQGICSNFTNNSKKYKTISSIQQTELDKTIVEQEGFTSYVGFTKYIEGPQSSKIIPSSIKNFEKFQLFKSSKSQSIAQGYDPEYLEEQKKKQSSSDFNHTPMEIIEKVIENNIQKKQTCDCPQIMIVDDNQFNLYALSKVVQQYQFSCVQISDGTQAVEDIKSMYEENCCKAPKIIFMDIEMPLKNGYQTAIEINQFYESAKFDQLPVIIACTAYVGQEDYDKVMQAGMNDFINKPILKNGFQQLINNWQNLFI